MRPRKCSYASLVIQPEPVPVLGQSGDSMPTSSTPACSRATFTKPPMYERGSQASSASPLAGDPSWTKSSSVVSLGRNVTVSWTKFRTAMRIASDVAGGIEIFDQPRPGFAGSAKAVEAEGAAGEHLVLRLGRQRPEPLAEHLGRTREEAVRVGIISGPHDLVRPDVVGQHRDAAFDRLERDPAIALEQLARPRLRRGLVEALVIEVPVHAVEPRRDPATARLEKRDAQSRMTVDDTTPDHAEGDQHHLHGVRDHVARRAVLLEAVDADGRHRVGRSLVKADREVELLGHLPERLVHRVADHLLAVIRVGPQEPPAHPELFAGVAHLVDRQIDRLHRQQRDPEQAFGIRRAVVGEPAVVGAAHRGGKTRILDGAGEQAETWIEEDGIDAVGIHVDDARVRVEPAFAPLGILQGAGLDDALPDADGTQAADAARVAQQLAFDAEAFLTVFVDDEPRPALAELGIDIPVPQVERLEDVAVRVDHVVRARHWQSLRRKSSPPHTIASRARGATASPSS